MAFPGLVPTVLPDAGPRSYARAARPTGGRDRSQWSEAVLSWVLSPMRIWDGTGNESDGVGAAVLADQNVGSDRAPGIRHVNFEASRHQSGDRHVHAHHFRALVGSQRDYI